MNTVSMVSVVLAAYFGLNFVCALVLHLHAERQAHLRVRFLDVLVHFVLLTAFAIPVLLVVTAEAMFGGNKVAGMVKTGGVPDAGAPAA